MTDTRWWKYLQHLMGDQTQLEAARFVGISKSNITRWKDGARAAPDFVVKVARAYGANVLEALVAAEFITEEEAQLRKIRVGGIPLTEATDEQLAAEILRRMGDNPATKAPEIDELARRRERQPTDDPWANGTVPDFSTIHHDYAADSSPDETEERLNRCEDPID